MHAQPLVEHFHKIVSFMLSVHMDISKQNIQGLIFAHVSEVQPKYSTALFGDVGLQEDWPSYLHVENGDHSTNT